MNSTKNSNWKTNKSKPDRKISLTNKNSIENLEPLAYTRNYNNISELRVKSS